MADQPEIVRLVVNHQLGPTTITATLDARGCTCTEVWIEGTAADIDTLITILGAGTQIATETALTILDLTVRHDDTCPVTRHPEWN